MEILTPFQANPLPSAFYRTPAIKGIIRWCNHAIANQQGLAVITGNAGMGKSSLLRLLYGDYLATENMVAVFIPALPVKRPFSMVKAICNQLGVAPGRAMFDQMRLLEAHVFNLKTEHNQTVICFIDEAQALDNPMLETLRVMLNFETDQMKLMNFVLAGTPELWTRVSSKRNKGLHSRAFLAQELPLFSVEDTRAMLQFRCENTGVPNPFTESAVQAVHRISEGVPRAALIVAAYAYSSVDPDTKIDGDQLEELYDRLRNMKESEPELVHGNA